MKHKLLTMEAEAEIERRLKIRREYSTKNLMFEFHVSRSVIDRIAKQSKKLANRETKQKVSIAQMLAQRQLASRQE